MRKEIKRNHCSTDKDYKSFYERQAKNPGLTKMRKGSRMKPINWAVREILNFKEPPCKILDVGCQHGIVELILAALWYDITSIDVAEGYIRAAKNNTGIVNQYIRYEVLPVEKLNQLNDRFHVISCLSVLEHVKDFDAAFTSILNACDDNSMILSVVPIGKSWFTEEHVRIFTDENIYDYFPKTSEISKIHFSKDPNKLGWFAVKYIKKG